MIHRLVAAALFGAGAVFAGAAAQGAGPKAVAVAVYVGGEVKVKRAGAAEPADLKAGDNLCLGDFLKTGPGGKASLVLVYGAELRVNENTVLDFVPGPKGGGYIRIAAGQVWTRLLHKKVSIEIRTATAVCAIRGTQADIEQREVLTVKVYEGHVDVKNPAGQVSLKAGEISRVSGPAAVPLKPAKMRGSEAGKWQEGVTAPDLGSILEKLEAAAGNGKELEFRVGAGKADKEIKIKLKKDGGKP